MFNELIPTPILASGYLLWEGESWLVISYTKSITVNLQLYENTHDSVGKIRTGVLTVPTVL